MARSKRSGGVPPQRSAAGVLRAARQRPGATGRKLGRFLSANVPHLWSKG